MCSAQFSPKNNLRRYASQLQMSDKMNSQLNAEPYLNKGIGCGKVFAFIKQLVVHLYLHVPSENVCFPFIVYILIHVNVSIQYANHGVLWDDYIANSPIKGYIVVLIDAITYCTSLVLTRCILIQCMASESKQNQNILGGQDRT